MANGERFSIRYSLFTMKFSWRSNADSKAAGAWAIPTALPSSPIQLPSFRYGIRWASELKDLPNAPSQEDSQPDRRIHIWRIRQTAIGKVAMPRRFGILHKRLRVAVR